VGRDAPTLDLRLVRALGLDSTRAVEILARENAGPAAAADLRPGDLIVGVNEQPVDGIDALHRALARVAPGSELGVGVVRRTQRLTVGLTAREPP
jgi:S1-C subfamily serine protease